MDEIRETQLGEKGHAETSWQSGEFMTSLVQLFFQLCRGGDKAALLTWKYSLLVDAALERKNDEQINFLLSLLLQTRDASEGKGEKALFYALLECWDRNPESFGMVSDRMEKVLSAVLGVQLGEAKRPQRPYGSFRDVKYLLEYYEDVREWANADRLRLACESPLISIVLRLVDIQLRDDRASEKPSLLAKWLPREKSKFAWQIPLFICTHCTVDQWSTSSGAAKAAGYARYRRDVARINKQLGTVQIHQCAKDWATLDFAHGVTSSTMRLQKDAFRLEGKRRADSLSPEDRVDREICKSNYMEYVASCVRGDDEFKAKDVTLGQLVKDAWYACDDGRDHPELELAYASKVAEVKRGGNLRSFCAVCDTSGSMTWDNAPLYDAVGMALLVAECSMLGQRIMTFATDPKWVCLDKEDTFLDKVRKVRSSEMYTGASTNLYKSLDLILSAIRKARLSDEDVATLNLMILSDMQIDTALRGAANCLDEGISKKFGEAGYLTGPNIVYWNMKSTTGFPVASFDKKGVVLLSGYEISTLQKLCDTGVEGLRSMDPVSSLGAMLKAPRYSWFWS